MATDNLSKGLLKLFRVFSFQCGDTACTWPTEICNRDREPFTVCKGASPMTYLQSNFGKSSFVFCCNQFLSTFLNAAVSLSFITTERLIKTIIQWKPLTFIFL